MVTKNDMFNEDASWKFNSGNESSNIKFLPSDNIVHQEYGAYPFLASLSSVSSIAPATSSTLKEPSAKTTTLRRSIRDKKPNPTYVDNTSCTFALLLSDRIYFEDAERKDK